MEQSDLLLRNCQDQLKENDNRVRKFSCESKKHESIAMALDEVLTLAEKFLQYDTKSIAEVRAHLGLNTLQDVKKASREELKGILRILSFGGFEKNPDFMKMWTGGLVPIKATNSFDSMAAWCDRYGNEPNIIRSSAIRQELEIRLCHYLQLDEPEDLSIHPDTPTNEKLKKMMTLASNGTMSQEEMIKLMDHLKTQINQPEQLEQIEEGDEGNED